MKIRSGLALLIAVIVCMVLVVALAVAAPWLVRLYTGFRGITPAAGRAILIAYYGCSVPALIALGALLRLLLQLRKKRLFDRHNPVYFHIISLCCLGVALVCAAAGIWYPPLFLVWASMLFLFLTVRTVCSWFIAAVELQEENDMTI